MSRGGLSGRPTTLGGLSTPPSDDHSPSQTITPFDHVDFFSSFGYVASYQGGISLTA